tara:strand:+ start:1036 stop:1344 length:309 start_codon:yes stop_codon:yes gene_type:complete
MQQLNFHNIISKKQELKTTLCLNKHKLQLIKRYKKKQFLHINLNKTQKELIKSEYKIKQKNILMEQLYNDFIKYEHLNNTCWDLSKLLDQYYCVISQIDEIF